MPALSFLNLSALLFLALVALSSAPRSAHALVADHVPAARNVRPHDAIAKRKRDSSTASQCKPRPTSQSQSQSQSPTPTPTPTPISIPPSTTTPPPVSTPTPTSTYSPPTTTSPPTLDGSKKWGLAWGEDPQYLSNFLLPRVKYIYNWSPWPISGAVADGLVDIPMAWGWKDVGDFQHLVLNAADPASDQKYVLAINEPNEPSQANMDPDTAAGFWRTYIEPLAARGWYTVSPACTNDASGLAWYEAFFQSCGDCHVDAIAFHAYTTDAEQVIQYATNLTQTYNKPIWITEFADQNFSGSGGQAGWEDVKGFATAMANFVENTPWVEAAFPFGVMDYLQGVNSLNSLISGGQPTALAQFYFSGTPLQ